MRLFVFIQFELLTPAMKKAYLILAHKNLNQLRRLLLKLDDGKSYFFIHIDLKTEISASFQELIDKTQNITLVKRISTRWGGFSLADATLNGLKAIKASGLDFQYISLLSGQDYPIKSNKDIDAYLSDSEHSIFLDYFPLPDYRRWDTGGTYRYKKYFFGTSSISLFFSKSLNLLATFIPPLGRKMPFLLRPYCGSQWWTIDQYAMNYIINYIDQNPKYYRFHKYTFAPDELFFHIILLNAKYERIQKGITNNNLRYMKWISYDRPHPEILTENDLHDLKSSSSLFARKFDPDQDEAILNSIDEKILAV
jgi:hypothetical protein